MKKIAKKEIRLIITNAIDQALLDIGIDSPSKKTKKAIAKASGMIFPEVKQDLKKLDKKQQKVKEEKNGTSNEKAKKKD